MTTLPARTPPVTFRHSCNIPHTTSLPGNLKRYLFPGMGMGAGTDCAAIHTARDIQTPSRDWDHLQWASCINTQSHGGPQPFRFPLATPPSLQTPDGERHYPPRASLPLNTTRRAPTQATNAIGDHHSDGPWEFVRNIVTSHKCQPFMADVIHCPVLPFVSINPLYLTLSITHLFSQPSPHRLTKKRPAC